ncbi:hypothetical protein PIB30_003780 [Stylosanthes scabra]|uniref:PB1-like domain-containing protein n=1 Tax=Stylosanthes scabra TaxID=79078 RepID=A0ABU6R3I4_9FABA|nr:hypothetical protein [Stylosanthes scabra]
MAAFVVPVIHHGGRFLRAANGELSYTDGIVKKYKEIDIDFLNKEDLLFEAGLHLLRGDMDVNNMCEFTLNHNLKEFYIYIEHVVSVLILPEVNGAVGADVVPSTNLSSSSSDDGGYKSAEDEPYKPPPPGFECNSREVDYQFVHSKKKKDKAVESKKKKFTGKRRKKHVLHDEGSGL